MGSNQVDEVSTLLPSTTIALNSAKFIGENLYTVIIKYSAVSTRRKEEYKHMSTGIMVGNSAAS